MKKLKAKGGDAGKGALLIQAANKQSKGQVWLPSGAAAALQGATGARVQMITSDAACFEADFLEVKKADGVQFKAKAR